MPIWPCAFCVLCLILPLLNMKMAADILFCVKIRWCALPKPTRAWYRVGRRQTVIKPHQLSPWYQAVISLKQDPISSQSVLVADYLLFLLFTGLQRQEAAILKWSDIDLNNRSFTLTDTKNRQPLTLLLTDSVFNLLEIKKLYKVLNMSLLERGKRLSDWTLPPSAKSYSVIRRIVHIIWPAPYFYDDSRKYQHICLCTQTAGES